MINIPVNIQQIIINLSWFIKLLQKNFYWTIDGSSLFFSIEPLFRNNNLILKLRNLPVAVLTSWWDQRNNVVCSSGGKLTHFCSFAIIFGHNYVLNLKEVIVNQFWLRNKQLTVRCVHCNIRIQLLFFSHKHNLGASQRTELESQSVTNSSVWN